MCFIFLDSQGNPLNFERCNGNEVAAVRDSFSGLDWEVKSQDEKDFRYYRRPLTWFEFNDDYIAQLNEENYGGFDDWRVPSKDELRTLINYTKINPAFPQEIFKTLMAQDYWCGRSYGLRPDCGWVINLNLGSATAKNKTLTSYGVAVRGRKLPEPNARFIDNGDGTITDTFLKLMWQKNQSERKSYNDILKELPTYNFAGYNNWRLPTMHELNSIFDESHENGNWYFDEFFEHDKLQPPILQHITSNLFKNTYVWVTNFNFGYDGYYGEKSIPLAYRLVRNLDSLNTKFQMPSSGQTEIFNDKGKVINVDFMRGKTSCANLKHCLIDFQSGLHYEKSNPRNKYTFDDALKHVEDLNAQFYGGKNTWRLPTVDELRFIVDYSKKSPAVFESFAPYIDSDFYWTSDTHKLTGEERVWAIFFGYGCAVPIEREQLCGCIAVSEGYENLADRSPARYTVGNGVVLDNYTKLMWLRDELPMMTAPEAEKYLAENELVGYNDWRMPDMKELSTLFNRRAENYEFLDKNLFPHVYDHSFKFLIARETFNGMFEWGINLNFCYDGYYADRLNGKYIIKPVRNI